MDDATLWELERKGHLVAHCRARFAAADRKMIEDRNRRARRDMLRPRWAA